MNLFDLSVSERPPKGIIRTKQGGWAGAVDVGDVVNINNETFRVVGPPYYNTKMLRGEVENGYVLIEPDGSRSYHDMQGELHRDDGPAESWRGNARWYRHGQLHREDGPAITWADGSNTWYYHDKRHREDGPAVIYDDGTEMWFRNGNLHREDGPAITRADGTVEYWLHDKQVNKEDLP